MSSSRVLACLAVFLGLGVCTLRASTISWINTSGGVWSSPANWSPNQVPGPGDTVQITNAGTYTVTVDTNVTIVNLTLGGASGTQTLTNSTQTMTITNGLVTANGILSLGGGTLTAGSLTVQGVFNWFGATVLSPVTVATGAVLNFGGSTSYIEGPVTNTGTINWSGTSAYIGVYNNQTSYKGAIYNQAGGLFNLQNDQAMSSAYGFESFNNAGTVRKTAGTGATSFSLAFTNSGTVDAQSGSIRFNSGGNIGGTYNTASNAIIEFDSSSFVETGPVSVTGAGICRQNGATVTLTDRIIKFVLAAGNVQLSPTFEGGGTIQSLQLDGAYLAGTNVVTGTLGINGGGLATASPLTVAAGGVLNFNGAGVNLFAPLTNSGTVNWSGGALILYDTHGTYTGAVYNQPTGLFNLQNDQGLGAGGGYGYETFHNAGTVRKSAGLGTSYFSLTFLNSGTVDAQSGNIHFNSGGNIGGTYNTAPGSFIEFNSGSFTETAPVNITGSGICQQNGATVTLSDRIAGFLLTSGNVALTPTFQANGTIQNLQLDGAYLTGTNVVTGTLGINGGGLATASPLTVASNGVLNFNGAAAYIESPLTNFGTVNWSGSTITLYDTHSTYAGAVYNQPSGLFNLQNDQVLAAGGGYGYETFHNAGMVRKTGGVGQSTIGLSFINSGTVSAQSGTIQFTYGGNLGGAYNAASGAAITFTGGNFTQTGPVAVTGAGLCRQNGGTVTLNDRIVGLLLNAGNVALLPTFQTNGTIQNLQLDGAYLTGTNVVTGTLGINGGGLATASPLTVYAGGVLNFNGAAVYIEAPLTNFGTVNWSGSTLTLYNNNATYTGMIWNQPGGIFNLQSDQTFASGTYIAEFFVNNGTVRKTAGLGTTGFSVPFTNHGILDVQSGVLRFNGAYSQSGGTMNFGITGRAYFGQIAFAGNAPITGALSLNLNSGYFPSAGDSFTLISYASQTGVFTSQSLPPAALWQTNYGATTFAVTALGANAAAGSVTFPPIANRDVNVGAVLLVTNSATDENPSNQITYSLTAAPAGASIGSTSGILQWRAPAALAGTMNLFTVQATDNGTSPASYSQSFYVFVNPIAPVILTPLSDAAGQFTVQINGSVGPDYAFWASTNLINWTGISTSTPSFLPFSVTDTNAGAFPSRFYRVVLGP